jgi:hypothetical protein
MWRCAILNIPIMDGEQLLQELSNDAELMKAPVVVVSTDSTDLRGQTMPEHGGERIREKTICSRDSA